MTGPLLVTGAGGFIGQRLVGLLRAQGRTVTGWTRADADLTQREAVAEALMALAPSTIFHLAASNAALAESDDRVPAAEVAMVANLAAAMPGGCRLLMTGSMAEYGYSGTLAENDPRAPRSTYGRAKAAASDHAVALAATGAHDLRVARLFGVYGPGEAARRLVPHLVAHLAVGQPVDLGDAEQVRDFVHVDDVCDRLIALAEAGVAPAPVVNIGTGVGVTVGDVARAVADRLGADHGLLRFGALPRRAIDEDVLVAETRLLGALGAIPAQHWLAASGPAQDYIDHCLAMQRAGA
jgi:nucleoside-diphosphate-sugar epimerase